MVLNNRSVAENHSGEIVLLQINGIDGKALHWSCAAFYVIPCRSNRCVGVWHTPTVYIHLQAQSKSGLGCGFLAFRLQVSMRMRIHSLWRQQSKNVTYSSPSSLLPNLNGALCSAMYYDNRRCSHASHTHVVICLLGKWQGMGRTRRFCPNFYSVWL